MRNEHHTKVIDKIVCAYWVVCWGGNPMCEKSEKFVFNWIFMLKHMLVEHIAETYSCERQNTQNTHIHTHSPLILLTTYYYYLQTIWNERRRKRNWNTN